MNICHHTYTNKSCYLELGYKSFPWITWSWLIGVLMPILAVFQLYCGVKTFGLFVIAFSLISSG